MRPLAWAQCTGGAATHPGRYLWRDDGFPDLPCLRGDLDRRRDVVPPLPRPVRHLTPREQPLPPLSTVVTPPSEPERSRWKAGVNTFGPVGRVAITTVVLLLAPLSANPVAVFVLWPCYLAMAVVVLRSVWTKDFVLASPTPEQIAAAGPSGPTPEPHRAPVPRSTLIAWGMLIAAGIALSIVWDSSGHVVRTSIAMAGSIVAIVLWIRFAVRN